MDQLLAIRTFQKIAECRSFTKAAAQLDMPRSTVSKALIDLEEYLGTKLIQRTTRSVTLTVEGIDYYNRVNQLMSALDEADEALMGMKSTAKGRLRVDVYSSLATFVLFPMLDEFRQRYPDIQLILGSGDRPVNLVEEGIDCVIRAGKLADSSMIGKTIYKDKLVTCASAKYIKQFGMPESSDELEKSHQIVGYISANNGEVRPMIFNNNGVEKRISRFNIATNDSASYVNFILSGYGIGQTHASVVSNLLFSGELIQVLARETDGDVPISLLYPPTKRLSARVRLFVDWITQRLSERVTPSQ
ncbi:TPA: LysR substrate-binding domain-containing protein [Vibrio parahaemolyticus]